MHPRWEWFLRGFGASGISYLTWQSRNGGHPDSTLVLFFAAAIGLPTFLRADDSNEGDKKPPPRRRRPPSD